MQAAGRAAGRPVWEIPVGVVLETIPWSETEHVGDSGQVGLLTLTAKPKRGLIKKTCECCTAGTVAGCHISHEDRLGVLYLRCARTRRTRTQQPSVGVLGGSAAPRAGPGSAAEGRFRPPRECWCCGL